MNDEDAESDLSVTPPFLPSTPFNNPDTDVILRSSDGVDFHVHRLVLSLASGLFKQMFLLPQPPGPQPSSPTIPISEPAVLLDRVLRFWYPGAETVVDTTLDELRDILEVIIIKYDIQFVVPSAQIRLRTYIFEDPVGVFIVACRQEWKELAEEAAKRSLAFPIRAFDSPFPAALNYASTRAYYSFLSYHAACGRAATMALQVEDDDLSDLPGFGCGSDTTICTADSRGCEFYKNDDQDVMPTWFSACLRLLAATLSAVPAAAVDTGELRALARKQTKGCEYCSGQGLEELTTYLVSLKKTIDENIDEVELKLDF
ncbi:hypothetical protein FB45DRAFT_1059937 [Roridomyces roridus]|uniref:BTB domain-containing protein n=1 Tax=Roridomyces roridus TaxID=1738132 RepID=A0AAD7BPQ6_9AGAR|nr:hypothetical protein FB45DRAFT_1059937 [Roridomyces roridus]